MGKLTRRGFLLAAGSTAATFIVGCVPRMQSGQTTGATDDATQPGTASSPGSAMPAVSAPDKIIITPSTDFYEQSFSQIVQVELPQYRLTVDGLVDTPLEMELSDLKALPSDTFMRTLECIGNPVGGPLIGNANWTGFKISDLLSRTHIQSKATHARFQAADGYFTSVELGWLLQPDTILVYEMNGEPLPAAHGYPLRILMPGLYGQKMPKWITRIEFIDHAEAGFWESQGWDYVASVKTNSIIQQPQSGKFPAGPLVIYGVAFAGKREVASVQVQVDDEAWKEARLLKGPQYVWAQWAADWDAMPGRHTLAVRATDSAGFTQSARASGLLDGSYPAGTDAIHSITVQIA